ncbi:MAG: hypothetical protein FD155_1041 [Bacteroidetes bacterium]|nr:MAG: hypothetical protein FD155_1041 [Bacteroidota bacterium]
MRLEEIDFEMKHFVQFFFFQPNLIKQMSTSLIIFNLGKKKKDLSFLDVSYQHHEPGSGNLIVYNNSRSKKCNITIIITDDTQRVFQFNYDEIPGGTALQLPLNSLGDHDGNKFHDSVVKIEMEYAKEKITFSPEGKKFSRSK